MAHTDRDALVSLYNATGGANWKQKANWDTGADLSQWCGIKVDDQGRVVELNLFWNNLQGSIPKELGALDKLEKLSLYNKITGLIPGALGVLSKLKALFLFNNQLSGPIPPELGNLGELQALDLQRNQFTVLQSTLILADFGNSVGNTQQSHVPSRRSWGASQR
ncbi:unnamed protein product [Ectocarpus sp. 12 AP-2014]